MSTFAYIGHCRVNACTVYALNNSKDPRSQDSFKFGMDLVMSLVLPFIEMRPRVGLSTAIQKKLRMSLVNQKELHLNQICPAAWLYILPRVK